MINLHDWFNSVILIILGVLMYTQRAMIANMKNYTQMLDPNRLKQANDFIRESMDQEVNSKLNKEKKKILDHISKRVQQTDNKFYEQWNELIQILFNIMIEKSWPEREQHLKHYPKTGDTLRELLKAYDSGELQNFAKKHKNES
jgi:hypothetical protein